jgi:hypothetical protein
MPRFTCTATSFFNPKVDRAYVIIFIFISIGKTITLLIELSRKRDFEGGSNRNLQEDCFPPCCSRSYIWVKYEKIDQT